MVIPRTLEAIFTRICTTANEPVDNPAKDPIIGSFQPQIGIFIMRQSSLQTSLLLALLFKRSKVTRARLSEITIRKLSGRSKLRSAFISVLKESLDDLGYAFLEIERGYAMIPMDALNGAPSITANKYLPDLALLIKQGKSIDWSSIEGELGLDQSSEESDGEEA